MQQAHISIAEQVRFVPVNFDTGNLADKLSDAGFGPAKKTLFVWEGVTYYLRADVVKAMLAFVTTHSPAGSSICFDYAALSDQTLNDNGTQALRQLMRARYANEPTKFGLPVGEIESFLADQNLHIIEHLTAAEMTEKYLPRDTHLAVGKIPALFCLVHALVK